MLVFKLIILIQAVLNPVVAEVLCSKDVNITKGQVEFLEGRGVGSVLQYTCPNHHRASPVSWRVCGADGKWSPIRQPAACVMYHCSGPVTLENGWVSPRLAAYSVGQTVEFQCRPGYTHYGAPNITCLPTGKWSAPPAVCDTEVKSFCGDPGVPAGGQRVGRRFEKGARVRYTCYRNLVLMGPSVRTCLEDGSWSGVQPQCEGLHAFDDPQTIAQHFSLSEHALLSPEQELHLYFLIKASRSVGKPNLDRAIYFVYMSVDKMPELPKRRVDLIGFGATAKHMGFNPHSNPHLTDYEEFLNGTGVNTGHALQLALAKISENLPKDTKTAPAKNLIILITDGRHNMGPSPYSIISNMTKIIPNPEANLEIFVIGIGGESRRHGLDKIASQKAEPRAFYLPDYSSLQQLTPKDSASTCGVRGTVVERMSRVFGGQRSVDHQWPWQVMVLRNGGYSGGGGSIISQRWVLTAAHVLHGADGDFYDRKTITVLAGVIKRPTEAQTVPPALEIDNYIVHSDYKTKVGVPSFDIALLRMKEDIVFDHKRRPVCLPCTVGVSEVLPLPSQNWTSRCHHQDMVLTGLGGADYRAVSGFVSGWGLTEKSPWASEDLVHGAISVQPRELCGAALVNEGVFCAYSVGVDACKGDSGGPFVIKRNGRWIQIGIVSYGSSHWCMNGTMGFYTSLPKFMPWIREQVGTDLVYT